MTTSSKPLVKTEVIDFDEFAQRADYSLINTLNPDPKARDDGQEHSARQVFSGHFVPVTPTPLPESEYVGHSHVFFDELGLSNTLVEDDAFKRVFSGDLSCVTTPMRSVGWATGYALSIYGTEYVQQCPFGTGNGYGDGRAISVFEGVFNGQRWEMQLKGGGQTPYCRGADGRAVLRSSVREFLAQDYMHALGVATSRSLTLYVSKSEKVTRPWYSDYSLSGNPDTLIDNPAAITTRVAPSFLRVGQLELFARRARSRAHPKATDELRSIIEYVIEREYKSDVDTTLPLADQVIELATYFRERLTSMVADWLRVGYCQGNFNSDNCALGGFTLDYGPFGFCEIFDVEFQPWVGGGQHFSFFNQPAAAEANYHMFYLALRTLLANDESALERLDQVRHGFAEVMQQKANAMWAAKLGLPEFDSALFAQLLQLMMRSEVDYTMFFRELSNIPHHVDALKKSFYVKTSESLDVQWQRWLDQWRGLATANTSVTDVSAQMKQVNPKYTWREWLVVPAYQQAMKGDYELIGELQTVFSQPYEEQSKVIEDKYYRLKPKEFFDVGGVSHYSCSS